MEEQVVLPGIVGVLAVAVGGLAYAVRQQKGNNGKHSYQAILEHLNQTLERQSAVLERQTEVLTDLSIATKIHNAEAQGRQNVLETILRQIQGGAR